MLTGPFLCHGVSWNRSGPSLTLATPPGVPASLPLDDLPALLGFRLLGDRGERFCLGYSKVLGPTDRRAFPCPEQTTAERGYQCGPCFARDDFRFMHDVHRSGVAPPGLAAYLAQEHWLYVATFADGSTKVGTASHRSKWSRLTEQGAVVARYVAHADDGRIVRVLEDAATRHAGLPQAVRSAAKTAALVRPLAPAELDAVNRAAADALRELLAAGVGIDGFETVEEQWQPPGSWEQVVTARAPVYPLSFETGDHGGTVLALLGQTALLGLPEGGFLLNLALLRGRRVELGEFRSAPIAVQDELF
ncbi:hypothetical protein GCM10027404_01160 [Arthrobacter tumbae]|uniref:DUF2797 domain-containing protein n=1 Tax=Arthrobacter tumbae TaxID=163874 RepID=UPI00195DBB0E|nr:DUF2797 domain-containing protein [Arthrobacter tumbae]MBM7780439.1 hypothetical protein [Arthrobacter tumbae]